MKIKTNIVYKNSFIADEAYMEYVVSMISAISGDIFDIYLFKKPVTIIYFGNPYL